jgi:hypothetical protein
VLELVTGLEPYDANKERGIHMRIYDLNGQLTATKLVYSFKTEHSRSYDETNELSTEI